MIILGFEGNRNPRYSISYGAAAICPDTPPIRWVRNPCSGLTCSYEDFLAYVHNGTLIKIPGTIHLPSKYDTYHLFGMLFDSSYFLTHEQRYESLSKVIINTFVDSSIVCIRGCDSIHYSIFEDFSTLKEGGLKIRKYIYENFSEKERDTNELLQGFMLCL